MSDIIEFVEWTTSTIEGRNACVGTFIDNANKPLVIRELINAPVERTTMGSRIALRKSGKSVETDSSKQGYSEEYVRIFTNKDLDADDFKDVPFSYLGKAKDSKGRQFYDFEVPGSIHQDIA